MGMALDGSVETLEKIENNGVTAFIDPNLRAYVEELGGVTIDFVQTDDGRSGYSVRTGPPDADPSSACGGCTSC